MKKNKEEFKINKVITIKLERGITKIYVKGNFFRQCKYLLLNKLYPDEIKDYIAGLKSIDEEIENLDKSLELEGYSIKISPETEFWAHCSNLQAWVENDYDTRLLHRNLAFPLLKRLTNEGDLFAKVKLKEEIVKRLESGIASVITYLGENRYTCYLSRDEYIYAILTTKDAEILLGLEKSLKTTYGTMDDLRYQVHFVAKEKSIRDIELFFDKNVLSFPSSIANLRNLKALHIYLNEFTEYLPEPKIEIDTVEELRIYSYGETTILDMFDKFPNIKRLYIYGGIFELLPESLGNLKKLEQLHLIHTSIEHLPKSISNLKDIQLLKIKQCNLLDSIDTASKLKNVKNVEYVE